MAISSRLALWEQKIREEDKRPPSAASPLLSAVPGGFIKQLVRETEKEAKSKVPETADKKQPSKLSDSLVLPFWTTSEEGTDSGEMSAHVKLLVNGLPGDSKTMGTLVTIKPKATTRLPDRQTPPILGHKDKDVPLEETSAYYDKSTAAERQVRETSVEREDILADPQEQDVDAGTDHQEQTVDVSEDHQDQQNLKASTDDQKQQNVDSSTDDQEQQNMDISADYQQQNVDVQQAKVWYKAGDAWLVQKDGFTLVTELRPDVGTPDLPAGLSRICLQSDGTEMEVNTDMLEKVNPPRLDLAEDLSQLVNVNESSVLNTLRSRMNKQLWHTAVGRNLLVVKPPKRPSFSGKTGKGRKAETVPLQIQSLVQRTYWNMVIQRKDQSIVPMGRTGAGKTTCCQAILESLIRTAGNADCTVTVEKIQAIFTVLRSFGMVATPQNGTSTRFSLVLSVDFNHAGRVAAAHLQTMLLERWRVCRRPEGESNFHIFSEMLLGLSSELRTQLHLHHLGDQNMFGLSAPTKAEEKQSTLAAFSKLLAAMETLGFTANEQNAIWHVLASIYHLGVAGVCKVGRKQFLHFESAQHAALALGCDVEELTTAVFKHHLKQILQQATGDVAGCQGQREGGCTEGPKLSGTECLEGFAVGLYAELFNAVISLINRSVSSKQLALASIIVVDTPGFLNPRHGGGERAACFEELCHNYVQERLQAFYHHKTFVEPLERYQEENVYVQLDIPECSPDKVVSVIDQTVMQVKPLSAASADKPRGLLWVLEEEVLTPGSSETVVLSRLADYYSKQPNGGEGMPALRQCEQPLQCEVAHQLGLDPVRYDLSGWFSKVKPNLSIINSTQILQESSIPLLRSLFTGHSKVLPVCRSVAGLEGTSQQVMHRAGCVRRTFTGNLAAARRHSACALIKFQADALINLIKKSSTVFLHCFVPHFPEANLRHKVLGTETGSQFCFDIPMLRTQLRAGQILEALQFYRMGFPDRLAHRDFRRRFQALAPCIMKMYSSVFETPNEKKATEELMLELDLEKRSFALGHTQIFLKPDLLKSLEQQRETLIIPSLVLLQAACQGHLARQRYRRRKIQELAVRCIQKNLRKHESVKSWAWWRLLCRVRPLLDVNIEDEKFRAKEEEIVALRKRLEKSEKERKELRQNADMLESKVTDLTAELSDERFKGEVVCQALEGERSEGLKLSRVVKEFQDKYEQTKKAMETIEKQLEESLQKLQNHELEASTATGSGNQWQIRYDCAQTEIDFLRKRQRQVEEKLECELQYRQDLESKLADLQGRFDEAMCSSQQLKKKCRQLNSDLQDTRVLMESLQVRNHDLEKKQRKFDAELTQALKEASSEKSLREKVSLENTVIRGEMFKLQKSVEELQAEIRLMRQQKDEVEAQLQDLSIEHQQSPESFAEMKKLVRELQRNEKELMVEISKKTDIIQQQEQIQLRFEMEMERMKQIHQKELEDKEEELEDVQKSSQRRLRQLEMQLEQEYEERQLILHEKQDLEGLIATLCEQIGHRDFDVEKRLRRDLRRTRALLADAQVVLQGLHDDSPVGNKEEMEKLHYQVEEWQTRCLEAEKKQEVFAMELENAQLELDTICRNKSLVDEQLYQLQREKADLLKRTEEDREDLNGLMLKHKALIAQSSRDITQIQELQAEIEHVKKEKHDLQEKLQTFATRVLFLEGSMVERKIVSRQEAIIRDLENKLEFQKGQIKRFEMLVLRLRDSMVKMGQELEQAAESEAREKENARHYQQRLQEMHVEMEELTQRELESRRRRIELEMKVEELTAVRQTLQADLETSIKRIADMQASLEEMSSDSDEECDEQSHVGSLRSTDPEEGIRSWLGFPRNHGSPFGSSTTGSVARLSVADSMSIYSARSLPKEESDNSRPRSSLSISSMKQDLELDKQSLRSSRSSIGEDQGSIGRGVSSHLAEEVESKRAPSSLALSEFVEELRRNRASERTEQIQSSKLGGCEMLPIYQTTGASVLRRRTSLLDEQEEIKSRLSEGYSVVRPGILKSPEPQSPRMIRSASLKSIPDSKDSSTTLPEITRLGRFSSYESLASNQRRNPSVTWDQEDAPLPRRLPPIRKLIEVPEAEEGDGELQLDIKSLEFKNQRFRNLTDEDKTVEIKAEENEGDILPAIRRSQSTSSIAKVGLGRREGRRPLSVHFGELPAPRACSPTRSKGEQADSDTDSSSSDSTISFRSIESAGQINRTKVDTEQPGERQEAEGKEDDISSVMMKYLRKVDS
ncbi:unconventional myosin-XVIIIb-like isoform X2 [Polypterus senegalus]|uniref:unconventional myosin-XVIIIb-like isoform X2 n=1 Tax=Polypterus senegalus TaxID=55291 RepID=UPI001962A0E3|nr:unconventional myosin-XVIIIb-like isoform X2 [Polypterus senegalus]